MVCVLHEIALTFDAKDIGVIHDTVLLIFNDSTGNSLEFYRLFIFLVYRICSTSNRGNFRWKRHWWYPRCIILNFARFHERNFPEFNTFLIFLIYYICLTLNRTNFWFKRHRCYPWFGIFNFYRFSWKLPGFYRVFIFSLYHICFTSNRCNLNEKDIGNIHES